MLKHWHVITRPVARSEIPAAPRSPHAEKGLWTRIINQARFIHGNEALELSFRGHRYPMSLKASLQAAAKRAGQRITVLMREPRAYVLFHKDKSKIVKGKSNRSPIHCEVCKKLIERPPRGASRQFVCAGAGDEKSWCQRVRRRALRLSVSYEEAARLLAATIREKKGKARRDQEKS